MIKKPITVEQIKRITAKFYNADYGIYDTKSRKGEIIKVKHMAIFMAAEHLIYLSDKAIAELFNLSNHSTIIHVKKKIRGYMETETNKRVLSEVEALKSEISNQERTFSNEVINVFFLGKSIN